MGALKRKTIVLGTLAATATGLMLFQNFTVSDPRVTVSKSDVGLCVPGTVVSQLKQLTFTTGTNFSATEKSLVSSLIDQMQCSSATVDARYKSCEAPSFPGDNRARDQRFFCDEYPIGVVDSGSGTYPMLVDLGIKDHSSLTAADIARADRVAYCQNPKVGRGASAICEVNPKRGRGTGSSYPECPKTRSGALSLGSYCTLEEHNFANSGAAAHILDAAKFLAPHILSRNGDGGGGFFANYSVYYQLSKPRHENMTEAKTLGGIQRVNSVKLSPGRYAVKACSTLPGMNLTFKAGGSASVAVFFTTSFSANANLNFSSIEICTSELLDLSNSTNPKALVTVDSVRLNNAKVSMSYDIDKGMFTSLLNKATGNAIDKLIDQQIANYEKKYPLLNDILNNPGKIDAALQQGTQFSPHVLASVSVHLDSLSKQNLILSQLLAKK